MTFAATQPRGAETPIPAAHRQALLETADAVGMGVAFVDRAGALVDSNPAFLRLCADEESRAFLAAHVRARFAGDGADAGTASVAVGTRSVAAIRVLPGEDVAVVQIGPRPAVELADLGLTPAQARVARGLAAGLPNRAIARQLGVSEYTARRHTEQVFAKLGVHRRAAVAVRLVGSG